MMLAGNDSAKKMGTRRYAGVVRNGRKYRSTSRTAALIISRAMTKEISEPTGDATAAARGVMMASTG